MSHKKRRNREHCAITDWRAARARAAFRTTAIVATALITAVVAFIYGYYH